MKSNPLVKQLPNLLTLLNMLLGLGVVFTQIGRGPMDRLTASLMILGAACLDGVDGKLARSLGVESELGKQLDSFADLISFGLAPVMLTLTHPQVQELGWPSYACLSGYVLGGAFRLARYNLGNFKEYFLGLPITGAGTILALANLLVHYGNLLEPSWGPWVFDLLVLILAGAMVSKTKVRRIC